MGTKKTTQQDQAVDRFVSRERTEPVSVADIRAIAEHIGAVPAKKSAQVLQ